jgi:uncharacterized ion transporter superfamily protein YfcC
MSNKNENVVSKKKPKFKIKVPNTYVLIFGFMVLAAILTYILPAGEYSLVKDEVTGRSLVDPLSFHFVDSNPTNLLDFLLAVPRGLTKSAGIIFLIFIIGGSFKIIDDTGALRVSISSLVDKVGNKAIIVVPIVMAGMSVLGMLGIVVTSSIAFIPLGVMLAKRLKIDPVAGVAFMYIGAYSGFAASPILPATLQLAQNIAGLEPLSGLALRFFVWAAVFVTAALYTVRYTKKVQADPSNSVLEHIDWGDSEEFDEKEKFSLVHGLILLVVVSVFAIYGYGALNWKWGNDHMAAMLLLAGLLSAVIARVNPDKVAESFIAGCKNIVFGTMIIGFASAISLILSDGKIIHTIIYGLSLPLIGLPSMVSANAMFLVNLVFNFFVSSGSGQAAIVMPLMAPMADIVGITRQVAVCAYQWGDGFSNTIIPTSGVLMAVLAVAKVPFEKWLKFMIPLFLMWVAVGMVAISIAVAIGYN